jgi:CO/xanthine dehydrogenase Mo-binding subunit
MNKKINAFLDDSSISRSAPRPDGMAKASGSALYVADLGLKEKYGNKNAVENIGGVPLSPEGGLDESLLHGRFYRSPYPRGKIKKLKLPEVPEGYYIVTAADIPKENGGKNEIPLAAARDMPVFAEKEVRYIGQIVAVVAGKDPEIVDSIINSIELEIESEEPCTGIENSFSVNTPPVHGKDNVFCRVDLERPGIHSSEAARKYAAENGGGASSAEKQENSYNGNERSVDQIFAAAEKEGCRIVEGVYETGAQEQLYMEPQGLIAWRENDTLGIRGSLQCPFYVSHAAAHVLGLPLDKVRVIQDTVGGAFGGKEDYPEIMGTPLAVAAWVTGKPVRLIMDREEDLLYTSKRHPSRCVYRSAVSEDGRILAMDIQIDLDGGAYETYSKIVLMRAVFTSLGVYNIPAYRIRGRALATNVPPFGAFRGFGAPQSLFALELHMEDIADSLGIDSLELRKKHFVKQYDPTVTGGVFREPVVLDKMLEKIEEMSGYTEKRRNYSSMRGSDKSGMLKGIGISFILHGAGFTGDGEQKIIKGEVTLHKTKDEKVEILCAAVEMGQGPQLTFRKVVSRVLGIPLDNVIYNYPDTSVVPDSGPTVASRTMMVVGFLVQKASEDLKEKWKKGREISVTRKYEMPPGMQWDQEKFYGDA